MSTYDLDLNSVEFHWIVWDDAYLAIWAHDTNWSAMWKASRGTYMEGYFGSRFSRLADLHSEHSIYIEEWIQVFYPTTYIAYISMTESGRRILKVMFMDKLETFTAWEYSSRVWHSLIHRLVWCLWCPRGWSTTSACYKIGGIIVRCPCVATG